MKWHTLQLTAGRADYQTGYIVASCPWTTLDIALYAPKPQVADAIPVRPAAENPETMGLVGPRPQYNGRALTLI
jgi:hypothetical protein